MFNKTSTIYKLGLVNLIRIFCYRLGIKLRFNRVLRLKGASPSGQFFKQPTLAPIFGVRANKDNWVSKAKLFDSLVLDLNGVPSWLANPLTGNPLPNPERPWWEIPDFDEKVGDIKLIWELSRMDWVLAFAQGARQGDLNALARLNQWLEDWCKFNPPYLGANWKCGQEASIRVMHLAIASLILGNSSSDATSSLQTLISLHLERIAPTLQYAIAQDNNHGTSEAAALFIGGSWLMTLGNKKGARWQKVGRDLLENRIEKLIGAQGSFSQYSVNYHRVLLDTISMVEVWRLKNNLPSFSREYYDKALKATQWLRSMVNVNSGDAPNTGANDGARLLQLTETDYRDYRPTVQLAMTLFAQKLAYEDGVWNDTLRWLIIDFPKIQAAPLVDYQADDGGFAVMREGAAMAMLRYPKFRFRPSQADALHLDLWVGSCNILRDAGTYSYNTEKSWLTYFGGTKSHNTVQFDDRDQMPRISRFLFGCWLKTAKLNSIERKGDGKIFSAGYADQYGASHERSVFLTPVSMRVTDNIKGFSKAAILRWRLLPGDWQLSKTVNKINLLGPKGIQIVVSSNINFSRCELVEGWESLYYLVKVTLPVLELEVDQASVLITEIKWQS